MAKAIRQRTGRCLPRILPACSLYRYHGGERYLPAFSYLFLLTAAHLTHHWHPAASVISLEENGISQPERRNLFVKTTAEQRRESSSAITIVSALPSKAESYNNCGGRRKWHQRGGGRGVVMGKSSGWPGAGENAGENLNKHMKIAAAKEMKM